jgi:sterol 3beta-glucosyltransferase
MILPLREIIAVQKAKPLRFDYSGMVLVIRGHEELFFEIGSAQKRDNLLAVVNHQIRLVQDTLTQSSTEPTSKKELKALEALYHAPESPEQPSDVSQIMFNSATSSFVTFQPPKRLHSKCSLRLVHLSG